MTTSGLDPRGKRPAILLLLFYVAATVSIIPACSPIKHDEALAKKRALEFAEVAIVKPNAEQAYAQLSDEAKRHVSLEKFRETLSRLHSDGRPERVSVTGYKPMFNEKAIYIFLTGEGSGKQFQYILTLEGTAASDYKVSIILRTA